MADSTPSQVTEQLRGLSATEVAEQRRRYGENVLPAAQGPTVWSILLSQFKSPLIYIILVAAAISLVAGERTDFILITAVVVVDVAFGFIQEYQAQRTYTTLKGYLKPMTTVIRDGARQEVEVREVVPGDLVVLTSGERIPADGEVIESARLAINEAILTGESESIPKSPEPESNQVYMGTTVLSGRGLMHAARTGTATELGQIAVTISEPQEQETPLRRRLRGFSRILAILVATIAAVILVTGVLSGRGVLEALRVSIVLAIAAVPESLLIAVTIILVLGMRAVLARNGLVRNLAAAEVLGSVTVIATDKTGTLTEGKLRVTRCEFTDRERALQAMALASNFEGSLELALRDYTAEQLQEDPQAIAARTPRLAEEPFSSETKYMIVAVRLDGGAFDFVKGAPEAVLQMCRATDAERAAILELTERWAGEGLKPLGLAYRPHGPIEQHSGYTWAGLIGMEDPVREGVPAAIALTRRAGIKVKVITGDYRRTAERIARNIGLDVRDEQVMEGSELQALDDAQLEARVEDIVIFSRIRPQDKLRIVQALQAHDEVTAMIGDGVNDAPALQRANIGVVVGTAADVAKETADLILLDNNFRTIVLAIEQGRTIFANIRKVVSYTMSNSFSEVLAILVAQLLGFPPILTVPQILWIHLIADGPPDIVLGFEPEEPGIMLEKPIRLSEPILPPLGILLAVVLSVTSAGFALALFINQWLNSDNLALSQSLVFAVFAVDAMIYILGYRSLRRSILRISSITRNKPLIGAILLGLALGVGAILIPPLRNALGLAPLSSLQWGLVFGLSFILLIVVELAKYLNARLGGPR